MQKKCELCGKPVEDERKRFCSISCKNTYVSSRKKKMDKIDKKGFKKCLVCGEIGNRDGDYCRKHKPVHHRQIWTPEMDSYLTENYPTDGPQACADALGMTKKQVYNRVSVLRIVTTKETWMKLVAPLNRDRMTKNNPMFNPETVEKVKDYYRNHPEERAKHMNALFEGHRKLQKDKPTKLEKKMFEILSEIGVEYEPFFMVKPKFIVDVRMGDLIIQADGEYWHGHPRFHPFTERQLAQQRRDKAQDAYLKASGYTVVRVWESDMTHDNILNILKLNQKLPLDGPTVSTNVHPQLNP